MFLVLEKHLVRADNFGVFVETLADTGAQADETLDAIRWDKRVAEDLLGFLADTIHAAGTLDEADDGPRQIEVYDDGGVLEVLTFTEHVGGDQHAKFFGRRNVAGRPFLPPLIAFGAEPAGVVGWFIRVTGNTGHLFEATRLQLVGEVGNGVGKLGEDDDLLAGMFLRQEFVEFGQLVILIGLPLAGDFEDGEQSLGILREMLGKVVNEHIRTQPVKIAAVIGMERFVARRPGFGEISQSLGGNFGGCRGSGFILAK